jgi:uncharacterized Zn finger protein (UPF0148 family)
MTMICPICGRDTQHADADQVVKCEQCLRSFQLEPTMNTESQQQIADELLNDLSTAFGRDLRTPYGRKRVLSAIERAETLWAWNKIPAAQPQISDQQEWSRNTIAHLISGAATHTGEWQRIVDAHNAELTAERERREQAEASLKRLQMAVMHGQRWSEALDENDKLKSELLSALAAIAKICEDYDNEVGIYDAVEAGRNLDLSLLHEHDRKEQEPLVDALKHIESRFRGKSIGIICSDALSKVKQ